MLLGFSVAVGPAVTVLGAVGIAEARRTAHAAGPAEGFVDVADGFLDIASGGLLAWGVIFAVTTAFLLVLTCAFIIRGRSPSAMTATIIFAVPYLVVLGLACFITPFVLGDSDEFVHRVVTEGPGWYLPAVRAICACSAVTLIAAIVTMVREPSVR